MDFNLTYTNGSLSGNNPADLRWGEKIEPLQAQNNVSYLQFIDIVELLMKKAHPEIIFMPYADNFVYDPEKGYIVYSLVERKPQTNNTKPRLIDERDIETGERLVLFIQGFYNSVKFAAVHKSPRIAEELVEAFEFLMLEAGPIFSRLGVQNFSYLRRPSDENKARYGDNVSVRSVIYLVVTQMILTTTATRLEDIYLQVQAPRVYSPQNTYENATPNGSVHTYIYDNQATPNTHSL